ncbi:MAG: glycosyltransferase family 4 protein [Actinomycetota bacterium]|nr:glycosyltransferase family 4 protein [Actinomycetota bacterium]
MKGLEALASVRTRAGVDRGAALRVVHVSPTRFHDNSVIGGGERYAEFLASAMAAQVDTTLITFGAARSHSRRGRLGIEVYPTLQPRRGSRPTRPGAGFLWALARFDVVHCHQFWTIPTYMAILAAGALGKRVFVTDLGGREENLVDRYRLESHVDAFLAVSEFSARSLPDVVPKRVVFGGVAEIFTGEPPVGISKRGVLFVGRILPHKGIDQLIRAISPNVPLTVAGRVYDPAYFSLLTRLADGKDVRFVTDADDLRLRCLYQAAVVTVLPSLYQDIYGTMHPLSELLGLVLLESMACGTPVVCTAVGGMPEIVEEGVTGFIVPPNDTRALGERIGYLVENPREAVRIGRQGRECVLRDFSWAAVADRCMSAYTAKG